MKAEEILVRCEAVIEELGLLYAHTPDEAVRRSLDGWEANMRRGWMETFGTYFTAQEIAEVVADVRRRIEERRREIEQAGVGLS